MTVKNESGGSLVEFCLTFPLFFLVLFAAFQMSILFVIQNGLEAGAREVARYGMTGQNLIGFSRLQSLQQRVNATVQKYTGGIVSAPTMVVTAYPDMVSLNANINGTSGSFGGSGQAVLYQVSYVWDTIIPLFGGTSLVSLRGQSPVLNESY